jgi:hypothetical protein
MKRRQPDGVDIAARVVDAVYVPAGPHAGAARSRLRSAVAAILKPWEVRSDGLRFGSDDVADVIQAACVALIERGARMDGVEPDRLVRELAEELVRDRRRRRSDV